MCHTVSDTVRPIAGKRRNRWLLLAVALVLALLLAEGGLRVFAHITSRERGIAFDSLLGWRLVPGTVKTGFGWGRAEPCRINSHGWRDREHSFSKPSATRRIVALGDSFVFGHGVDFGERFTEQLAERRPSCEVINLGVNGYGPDQELLVFENHGLRYQPDVVVLAVFLGNDLEDLRYERRSAWPKPWFKLHAGHDLELVAPRSTWDVELRSLSYLAEMLSQVADRFVATSRRAAAWQDQDTWPLLAAILARLQHGANRQGAQLLVLVIPPYAPTPDPHRELVARLGELLTAAQIPFVDVQELFAARAAAWDSFYLPCLHWTPAGHRVVAEAIDTELARRGW
jgi:hypothetical protein